MVEIPAERRFERELWIAAKPETVFAFLTQSDKIVRWFGTEAVLDAQPGGVFRVNVTGRAIAAGKFVAVEPHRRVVFSFGWESGEIVAPGASTVEITLTARDNGTALRLIHSGLPDDAVDSHGQGWTHYLDRLVIVAAGGDPGADPWIKDEDRQRPKTTTKRG
jgi:uncharacterized protein YndB with AHSA1/START domain